MDFMNNPFFRGTNLAQFFGVGQSPALSKTLHTTNFPEDTLQRNRAQIVGGVPHADARTNTNRILEEAALDKVRQEMQKERDGLVQRRMHEQIPITDTGYKPRKDVTKKTATVGKPSRFGEGDSKVITRKGKKMANVSKAQLKETGLDLNSYMNLWGKMGARPTQESVNEYLLAGG